MSGGLRSSLFGEGLFGDALFGVEQVPAPPTVLFSPGKFRLILADRRASVLTDRSFVAELHNWTSAVRTMEINKPETFSLVYPRSDARVLDALRDTNNAIVLYDNTNTPIHTYIVSDYMEDSTKNTINMNCQSTWAMMVKQDIDVYRTLNRSIDLILTDIFTGWASAGTIPYGTTGAGPIHHKFQQNTLLWGSVGKKISPRSIDSTFGNLQQTVDYSGKTIMEALEDLRKKHGGIMYVEPDPIHPQKRTTLHWHETFPQTDTKELRWNKNMGELRITTKVDSVRNKITAKGRDYTNREISVTVENAASQNTYGVRPKTISDNQMKTEDELTAWANVELERMKDPPKDTDVQALDLSFLSNASQDWTHASIGLGEQIRLVHEGLSVATSSHTVTGIVQDLSNPADIKINLSRTADTDFRKRQRFTQLLARVTRRNRQNQTQSPEQFPKTLQVDDFADVDTLLETTDHPASDWEDGISVLSGDTPNKRTRNTRVDGAWEIESSGDVAHFFNATTVAGLGTPDSGFGVGIVTEGDDIGTWSYFNGVWSNISGSNNDQTHFFSATTVVGLGTPSSGLGIGIVTEGDDMGPWIYYNGAWRLSVISNTTKDTAGRVGDNALVGGKSFTKTVDTDSDSDYPSTTDTL